MKIIQFTYHGSKFRIGWYIFRNLYILRGGGEGQYFDTDFWQVLLEYFWKKVYSTEHKQINHYQLFRQLTCLYLHGHPKKLVSCRGDHHISST